MFCENILTGCAVPGFEPATLCYNNNSFISSCEDSSPGFPSYPLASNMNPV